MTFQRYALPVARDVAEQTMFDLVPLAGSGRIVAQLDLQTCFICELLQGPSPESSSRAVAAPAVGRNQQSLGCRVSLLPHPLPPPINRRNGKLGRIVTDTDRNARFVQSNVVNAVKNRLAEFPIWKVVGCDFRGLALWTVSLPSVFRVSQRFFLLRVDRDRWLPRSQKRANSLVDVFELGVAVRMLLAFNRLAVGLQTVTLRAKQLPDFRTAYLVPLPRQFASKCVRTLTSPTKRRTRIATRTRLNQRFQRLNQLWLFDFTGSATTARTSLSIPRRCFGIIKLFNPRTDCSVRDAGSFRSGPRKWDSSVSVNPEVF